MQISELQAEMTTPQQPNICHRTLGLKGTTELAMPGNLFGCFAVDDANSMPWPDALAPRSLAFGPGGSFATAFDDVTMSGSLLGSLPTEASYENSNASDVDLFSSNWFRNAVTYLTSNGILSVFIKVRDSSFFLSFLRLWVAPLCSS